MNKLKLLAAVALAGLVGVSARAALPSNYASVNIQLSVLIQTNATTHGNTITYHVTKLKVTNKEVLARVAAEFGTLPSGAQLVLNDLGFYNGTFAVLNKDGSVFLSNVSSTEVDNYELNITDSNNSIYTGSETSKGTTYHIVTAGDLYWQDATISNWLEIYGPALVNDTFSNNDPESFRFAGVEDGFLAGHNAIVTGSVSSHGANSADF